MRIILTLLLPLALMLSVSCSKEMSWPDRNGQQEKARAEEVHAVTLRFRAASAKDAGSDDSGTKAYAPEEVPLTDGINRLDLFLFYRTEAGGGHHVVLTPDEGGTTTFTLKEKDGERVGVLAYANLDPDTAALLEGKTLSEFSDYYNKPCPLIWSAGNFDFDRILMAGSALVDFDEDKTIEISLLRTVFRIDLGDVVFDPENEDLVGQEVYLKTAAIINIGNYILPAKNNSIDYCPDSRIVFGSPYNLSSAFGGISFGYMFSTGFPRDWSAGTFSPGGQGVLAGSFPHYLNNNYQKAKGVLVIDAPGILREATSQTYDTEHGQGLVASSGAVAGPHSFSVNRSFYACLGFGGFLYTAVSDYDYQSTTTKFVLELSIGGKTYFYPIPINYPQPNTVYRIGRITIKDTGSEYSNFYEKKYAVSYSITVADWNELDLDNISVGVDPVTGEPVEST